MWIAVAEPCTLGCAACAAIAPIGGADDEAAFRALVDHAQATKRPWLLLGIGAEDAAGLARIAETVGRGRLLPVADAAAWSRARVDEVRATRVPAYYVTLHGASAERHDARAGAGSWERAQAMLASAARVKRRDPPFVGIHAWLTRETAGELPAVARLAAGLGVELLVSDPISAAHGAPVEAAEALAVLERAWNETAAAGVRLRAVGLARTRRVPPAGGEAPAARCDASLVELLRRDVRLASTSAGVRAIGADGALAVPRDLAGDGPALRALGVELAARGAPLVGLPPCVGGTGSPAGAGGAKVDACARCPFDARCGGLPARADAPVEGAIGPRPWWGLRPRRVAIVAGAEDDGILCGYTLDDLAAALRARGADVLVVSPPPPRRGSTRPGEGSDLDERLARGDLDGRELVIAASLATGHAVLTRGRLDPSAALAVLDFHMLSGLDRWRATWGGDRQLRWPSPRVFVVSGFPSFAALYQHSGFPLEQIAWRSFAITSRFGDRAAPGAAPARGRIARLRAAIRARLGRAAVPAAPPAHIVSGGGHMREFATLREAAELLPADVRPIDLYAYGDPLPPTRALRWKGPRPFDAYAAAYAASRFVVVPVGEDATRAAGITSIVLAHVAGRPVVATSTKATQDYVVDGVDGLLVPPDDPRALADAIARLDRDEALLARLAEGARAAAERSSVSRWADEILGLAPPRAPTPVAAPRGTIFRAW